MMRGSQTVDWSRAYGLMQRKSNRRIIASTAYSAAFARLLDPLCDLLLVDCDVAALMHGLPDRSAADLDMMLLHGKSVSRGAKRSAVAIELPGSAWMQSPEQALRSASRLLDETECCGVMLPLETVAIETTRFLVDRGIPVMSGVDISPPADAGLGRQFAEGELEWLRIQVLKDAAAVGQAGVFAIVATGRNDALALQLSKAVAVPVIGAESASLCDGDLLRDVECLALLNSVRRNADLNTRAATRPESLVPRGAGRAAHPSDRSALGAGTAGLRVEPRTAVTDHRDAGAPSARAASTIAPVPRADAVSKEAGGPERPPVPPIRRPQQAGDVVGRQKATKSAFASPAEDPNARTMLAVRRVPDAQFDETPPSDLPAGSLDRLEGGPIMNRAAQAARSTTAPEPDRSAAELGSRSSSTALSSSSDLQPSPTEPGPVSYSLQHSLEALFGLDPASGELPPRRLRPIDSGSDPEVDDDAVGPSDATAEPRRDPSIDIQRDRSTAASAVLPKTPPAVEPASATPQSSEPVIHGADTGAVRCRAVARRLACRAVPVRRNPMRSLVAEVTVAPLREETPVQPSRRQVRPRLAPPRAAAVTSPPGEQAPELRLTLPDQPLAERGVGFGRFAVRAAGVVLLIGLMIASGFGAAAYLKSSAGEVRTESAPAKTGSGGKGEFGAVQHLVAKTPPREAFAPSGRPVEVKVLQTRPFF